MEITKEIIEKFKKHPLYSTESVDGMEKEVLVKFFNPYGVGTWIITEASEENGDWIMYGLASLGYGYEWGYVSFNELNSIRVNVFGAKLPLERDMYIGKCKVKDLVKEEDLM